MELHALQRHGFVSERHTLALFSPCRDFELGGERRGIDHQRVIARRGEGVRQTREDRPIVMMDPAGLAVHDPLGPANDGAEGMSDALMP